MKFSLATAAAAAALLGTSAHAQEVNATEYATGLLAALNQNGLSALAGLAARINQRLLPVLEANINRNLTVLAPSNAAIGALGNPSDDAIFELVAYHVLNITDGANGTAPTVIAPTALTGDSDQVELPDSRAQVVVLARHANGTQYVKEPLNNITFTQGTEAGVQYRNLLVRPIDGVLTIPGNLTALASTAGLTQLAQLLTTANLLEPLEDADEGLTIFAPSNAAIQAVQETAAGLNQTQLQALLLQHVLNGTVAYSTLIPDSAVNAAGQRLTFTTNNTGAFVQIANTTARITQTDVLFRGGVVHVIDQVLVETATNTTAANDAASSASTAGPTPTPGGGSTPAGAAAPGAKIAGGLLGLTLVASAALTLL